MFLPVTKEEMKKLGWKKLDIIIVSGDTYIDSSYSGAAVIGRVLMANGYKVGIIAQPNIDSEEITELGEPELFWGVTAGAVDSMVANYTPTGKKRRTDDFTPGGENIKRPDRASIVYSNLIRKYFKNTKPIILGGIEASLRRVPHYDFWDNKIRKSILFDAKADFLIYGMGEKTIVETASKLKNGESLENQRGLCYISKEARHDYVILPDFEAVKSDKIKFIEMFNSFYINNDPLNAEGLCQKHDTRYLVQNPPNYSLSKDEIDKVYEMDYERDVHPHYKKNGAVKALDTIRYSITTHRGCYGECNFCAIAVHQGRTIQERSEESIVREAEKISKEKNFKGYINDLGGPTANMYGIECDKKTQHGSCKGKRCLYPDKCRMLKDNHSKQIKLLRRVSAVEGVKKVFVASGIRYDMIIDDKECGQAYLREIVKNHISGQMKIAPEHTDEKILELMGKPGKGYLEKFNKEFYKINEQEGKKQFLTYYLIAAHPGCEEREMKRLRDFAVKELHALPEQVQIFTPTPSTYSTLMYYTGMNPFTMEKMYVEKEVKRKEKQKEIVVKK